ncbi:L-lysine dehydrogenase [Geothermobacter hydrogeniphilus]|uniref:L-lysine dehydrogenase n=1 Tax=Geothermobacter hydrogeniphilus TaxID=1969733 RepID=A0A2K2H794_9BACT|nr:saccharopine dehydrogenase C-terminal domain-containing protein [Geothermobacter hydrogeniphilus]PNU19129.1 L-lysine dehydrogenase [Geothermobacter hydrogeniphilus]
MKKVIRSVLVVGLGKVGQLVATLLQEEGYRVSGLDRQPPPEAPFALLKGVIAKDGVLVAALKDHDAVVSCLPFDLNLPVARAAHQQGCHYFDLTEDVATSCAVQELAPTAKGVMAPQCGLAPGFISIVGADLAARFDQLRSIELRVGALPQHPRGLLGYAFNWSPEGVVNEYLNPCDVIADGKPARVPPMEGLETIHIDGLQLEAFTTSGGLGSMCETFNGKVETLNYKTIRYPGHCRLMRFFFEELQMKKARKRAGEILVDAKPPVNEDVVYIHAAVEGKQDGHLRREEFVRSYYPRQIAGQSWRAISWTTAAAACAVLELVARGELPAQGRIRQEEIPLAAFFGTPTGAYYRP